jgi:TolA-binding protein
MKRLLLSAATLSLGAASLHAQEPEVRRALPASDNTPPPVRRAEPVNPENYRNPAWMDRVRPATPARPVPTPRTPAPPVSQGTPIPVATPIPIATPLPLEPDPTPEPEATPEATPTVAEESSGPIAPAPAEVVPGMNRSLTAGNGFFRRKMYDMAVYEYEKFLIAEPNAQGRDGALFRLGESHRFLGNEQAARDAYRRLLAESQEGEFVGSAAYRLGEIFYAEGNYAGALDMFSRAEENAASAEVKLSAAFYQANALDKLGRRPQAAARFAKIAKTEGDNPYRDTAEFYVAEEQARVGKKPAAYEAYEKLSRTAEKPPMKAESMVKAAALAAELGHDDKAKELFDQALALPAIGDWGGVAKLGVLRLAYDAGRYKEVVAAAEKGFSDLPADGVPEAMLITANAHRQLGDSAKALALYEGILSTYPDSSSASQARFQRLVCLEASGAADLGKQLDDFLAVSTDPRERAQAMLLKAETLFKTGDYAGAAPLYAKVLKSPLPDRLLNQARYKLGWCQLQTGQSDEAIRTFTDFIDDNPKSDLLPAALIQRAIARQQTKAYELAQTDFDRVISDFPKAKEREVALQQKALILGQQEKYAQMVGVFAQFLKEYPESKGVAQAEYWIGWQAFEKKDYAAALEHLKKARELDPKTFGERATLRIVLAYYSKEDRAAVTAEVDKAKLESLPGEVLVWLGMQEFDDGNYKKAEQYLSFVAARGGSASPDALLALSKARLAQDKFEAARDPIRDYLAAARDPLSRAKGLLASAEVSLGTGNYEDANKLVEEAMLLQPEGRYNGEARLLGGEVLMQRGDFNGAARAFMTISVLYDDPELTPKALRRAAAAYRKAGNSAEAEKALAERAKRYPDAGAKKKPAVQPTAAKSDDT